MSKNDLRIAVEGGTGTGKTRFLIEIQRRAAELGLTVVRGFTPEDPHGIIMRRADLPPDLDTDRGPSRQPSAAGTSTTVPGHVQTAAPPTTKRRP